MQELPNTSSMHTSFTKIETRRVTSLITGNIKSTNEDCKKCKFFTGCKAESYLHDERKISGGFSSLIDLPLKTSEIADIFILLNKYNKIEICHKSKAQLAIKASENINEMLSLMEQKIESYKKIKVTLATQVINGGYAKEEKDDIASGRYIT